MNRFSIIIPSLNQAPFIEQTIQSILDQAYPAVEIIVMDGGSTDGTIEILKRFGDKIQWISEKDNGQASAINKGIKIATGDILAYLNSDDQYLPYTLEVVNHFFQKHPTLHWATGDYHIIDSKNEKIQSGIPKYKNIFKKWPYFSTLCLANFIAQPSTFWRREAFEEIGFFNENLHYTMDYDYWLRLISQFPLGIIPQKLSCFRIHDSAKGSTSFKAQFDEELSVVKQHTPNSILIGLHRLHSWGIVTCYNRLKK